MATNFIDQIIERLFVILNGEFKSSIKIYKMNQLDIHHNSICFQEMDTEVVTNWSPDIIVEHFPIDIILRQLYQKDANKKEWINLHIAKIKEVILRNRSDSTTGWFNGHIMTVDPIEIETDDEDRPKFWKYVAHFRCTIAYDFSAATEVTNIQIEPESEGILITENFDQVIEE